ncbi:MAG: UV DNA damage repair endonuclease UvsE [Armatimonadota bacterium]|nr:UV DNA damage repair endonuclease UvsE [Armatimonadota bacterium]MDW8155698.1 UV DNA damage repair endonuclease UvsE [Armatimonadota bacterium]
MAARTAPEGLRLGYPCQNRTLRATTNHTVRERNVVLGERLDQAVRANLRDLERILWWNARQGIRLFRVGQHLIPFASHPRFPWDWEERYGAEIQRLGALARSLGIRLSFHPGQYVNPGSSEPSVRDRSLRELRYTARLLARFGDPEGVVVLHGGGVYGDRQRALGRLCRALQKEEEVLRFLALENDERCWSVADLMPAARVLGVPVVFDLLHHRWRPGGLSEGEALAAALETWGGRRPKVHVASQARGGRPGAHAPYLHREDWRRLRAVLRGSGVDVMVEAKAKERAVLRILRWEGLQR